MLDHRCTTNPIPFNPKPSVREEIRRRGRGAIEAVLDEELEATLGDARYQRADQRTGFRNRSTVPIYHEYALRS